MERIIIEGDTVSLMQVQEEKTVSLKTFKEEFRKLVGVRTPILPRDCVFYSAKDQKQVLLIEKESGKFKIKYHDQEYEICFPYHYFLFEFSGYAFDELSFFFRKKPITDLNNELYFPPIKNLTDNCEVCLGNELKFSIHGTLQHKVTRVISYFYKSNFNDDLNSNYTNHMPAEILQELRDGEERFKAWERLTHSNIDPCTLSWHKYKSFEEILSETLR